MFKELSTLVINLIKITMKAMSTAKHVCNKKSRDFYKIYYQFVVI